MAHLRTEKYDNINLLRAFAALAVVVYHVIERAHWAAFPRAGPLSVFSIGWIGVDLFFGISGFVIAYSALVLYRKAPSAFANSYWRRRISRILPLYLLTLVLWIAFMWPAFFSMATRDWTWHLFSHLGFIHNFWTTTHGSIDGPNWSLGIEMQFYLAIALLIGWIDRTPGWRIWLYGIAISWTWRAAMFWIYADGDVFTLFVKTTQLPGVLDEFGAGIFLAKWVLDGRGSLPLKGLPWLAAAVATGYVAMAIYWPRAMYWDNAYMVVFWRTSLSIFILCVLGAAVELPQVISYRWLAPVDYLGEISYGIYLWHLFALTFVIEVLGWRAGQSLAAVLALTIGAAALSWRYMEKPILDLARRRSGGLGAPPAQGVLETTDH
jgi:peptidoglycan/LPS O-acetylase OafA/YrhL